MSAHTARSGGGAGARPAAGGCGFSIALVWPDYVVTETATGRSWGINAVEAHLLCVVDGRRTFEQLVTETRARIRIRSRGETKVSEREVKSAFLRLSMGDILTSKGGPVAVASKYAAFTRSLGGAIAVLLTRAPNFPLARV